MTNRDRTLHSVRILSDALAAHNRRVALRARAWFAMRCATFAILIIAALTFC